MARLLIRSIAIPADRGGDVAMKTALRAEVSDVDMGHYQIRFTDPSGQHFTAESPLIGHLLDRQEPLFAELSEKTNDWLRIDTYLGRDIDQNERLPLLSPHISNGIPVLPTNPKSDLFDRLNEWRPVRQATTKECLAADINNIDWDRHKNMLTPWPWNLNRCQALVESGDGGTGWLGFGDRLDSELGQLFQQPVSVQVRIVDGTRKSLGIRADLSLVAHTSFRMD